MKIMSFTICAGVVCLGLASLIPTCHAQTITTTIPFGFTIAGSPMEPGTYTFRSEPHNVISVKGGSAYKKLGINPAQADTTPSPSSKLVFDKLGRAYFLREMWIEGRAEHIEWRVSAAERQQQLLAKRAAPKGDSIARVELPISHLHQAGGPL